MNDHNLFSKVVNDTRPEPPARGPAIISLVAAILSVGLWFADYIGKASVSGSLFLAAVGLFFAAYAGKKGNNSTLRVAGMVISIFSIALNLINIARCSGCFSFAALTSCLMCSGACAA